MRNIDENRKELRRLMSRQMKKKIGQFVKDNKMNMDISHKEDYIAGARG